MIWHDGRGACLFTKRLERRCFIWPSPADGAVTISSAQLSYCLSGIDQRRPQETSRLRESIRRQLQSKTIIRPTSDVYDQDRGTSPGRGRPNLRRPGERGRWTARHLQKRPSSPPVSENAERGLPLFRRSGLDQDFSSLLLTGLADSVFFCFAFPLVDNSLRLDCKFRQAPGL